MTEHEEREVALAEEQQKNKVWEPMPMEGAQGSNTPGSADQADRNSLVEHGGQGEAQPGGLQDGNPSRPNPPKRYRRAELDEEEERERKRLLEEAEAG